MTGKSALLAERERGPARRLVTALLSGERLAVPSEHPWPVFEVGEGSGGDQVGTVRSAVWSPKHGSNLALALVTSDVAGAGFVTVTPEGDELEASHLSYFGE